MPHQINFSDLTAENIVDLVNKAIQTYETEIQSIVSLRSAKNITFANIMERLERNKIDFDALWQRISHLNNVKKSKAYRVAFNAAQKLVTQFETKFYQNKGLYQKIKKLESNLSPSASLEMAALIQRYLKSFEATGIHLPLQSKKRLIEIRKKLSELEDLYDKNKTDSIHSWSYHITDEKLLSGLPDHIKEEAKANAQKLDKSGWMLTLAPNMVLAVLKNADSREVRQIMDHANAITASREYLDGKYDNGPIMAEMLKLRQEEATILGKEDYVAVSLFDKMATIEQVEALHNKLRSNLTPIAQKEFQELKDYAKEKLGLENIEPYDIAYTTTRLKAEKYDLDDKVLSEYLPLNNVLKGLLKIAENLFSIHFEEEKKFETWDKEVRLFTLYDQKTGEKLGQIYMDLYARNGEKRGGAWMDVCEGKLNLQNSKNLPVAFLNANFGKGTDETPSLLIHREVQTLFHELGHCLHHVFSEGKYPSTSGPMSVPWDAVEAPSKMMEHWIWNKETIPLFAKHYKTKAPLPDAQIEALSRTRYFQEALLTLTSACYSDLDLKLHSMNPSLNAEQIQNLWQDIRKNRHVLPMSEHDYFPNTFHHIFSGGYSAGYYTYKWSTNIAENLFSEFLKHGIMDAETGMCYRRTVLAPGGTKPFQDLVETFIGQNLQADALLKTILANQPDAQTTPSLIKPSAFGMFQSALGSTTTLLHTIWSEILSLSNAILQSTRGKMKRSALKSYDTSESETVTDAEKRAFSAGVDAAVSVYYQAKSCLMWEAYRHPIAYYAGLAAKEKGEDKNVLDRMNNPSKKTKYSH